MENFKITLFVIAVFIFTGIVPAIVDLIPEWVEVLFLFSVCAYGIWYAIRPERRR